MAMFISYIDTSSKVEAKQKQPAAPFSFERRQELFSESSLDWPYGLARNAGIKKPARPCGRRVQLQKLLQLLTIFLAVKKDGN